MFFKILNFVTLVICILPYVGVISVTQSSFRYPRRYGNDDYRNDDITYIEWAHLTEFRKPWIIFRLGFVSLIARLKHREDLKNFLQNMGKTDYRNDDE